MEDAKTSQTGLARVGAYPLITFAITWPAWWLHAAGEHVD